MTKFTRADTPKAETTENDNPLMPYTNKITLTVKVCEKPCEKVINGFRTISFPACHWQPKGKPMLFLQCIVFDVDVSKVAMKLLKNTSIIVTGKFGYDVHQGIAKHFILVDDIQTQKKG